MIVVGALAGASPRLALVDDRGHPLTGNVEVCFEQNLGRICEKAGRGGGLVLPERFDRLVAEGPEHGPTSARRADLTLTETGAYRLVVPRKAHLRLDPTEEDALPLLSLFPRDSVQFRFPAFRERFPAGGTLAVPAGLFVSAVSGEGGLAPDLSLLKLAPGETHTLDWKKRPGWSLVLRTLSEEEEVVSGAKVELTPSAAYLGADPGKPIEKTETAASGIALFSGLTVPLASVHVDHPAWLEVTLAGLSGTPGSFAFREVELRRGSSLAATVWLDGAPCRGCVCKLVDYPDEPTGPEDRGELMLELEVDANGVCSGDRLPPGGYVLRVSPTESDSAVEEWVELHSDVSREVEVRLERIRVFGEILRGADPAQGYSLEIHPMDLTRPEPAQDPIARVKTDEEGEYEVLLWQPGDHLVFVLSANGNLAATRRVYLGSDERELNLHLPDHELAGKVVDGAGEPVAEARIRVVWNGSRFQFAMADDAGRFGIPLDETGMVALEPLKNGYESTEQAEVSIQEGIEPPPVVLRMEKLEGIRGTVSTVDGTPAQGVSVSAYREIAGAAPSFLGTATTDGTGAFTVAADPDLVRFFYSGPRCPLSSALVSSADKEARLVCAAAPATLDLLLVDEDGDPRPGAGVRLVGEGGVIPERTLSGHLQRMGVPSGADGNGRLVLPALAPGVYELYLEEASSEASIALGNASGHLTSATLFPRSVTELEITLGAGDHSR